MAEKKQRSRGAQVVITFVRVALGTFLVALGLHGLVHSPAVWKWSLVTAAVLTAGATIGALLPEVTPERRARPAQRHQERQEQMRATGEARRARTGARTARMHERNAQRQEQMQARSRARVAAIRERRAAKQAPVPQEWPPPPPRDRTAPVKIRYLTDAEVQAEATAVAPPSAPDVPPPWPPAPPR